MTVETLQVCGFEAGPITVAGTAPVEMDNVLAQCQVSTTRKRTGAYSLHLDYPTASAAAEGDLYFSGRASTTKKHRRVRFWLRVDDPGAGSADTLWLWRWAAGDVGVRLMWSVVGTTYGLILARPGTTYGSYVGLSAGTDYIIELYWFDDASPVVKVYVDGVERISSTSADFNQGSTEDHLHFGETVGKAITERYEPYMDDFWIQAADAGTDLIPGTARIVLAVPDGDGDDLEWLDDVGGAGDYDRWDEMPNDTDTTYNESAVGVGAVDQLSELESAADAGLAANDLIRAVAVKCVAKVTAGTAGSTEVLVKDNGTEYALAFTHYPAGYTDGTWDRVDRTMPNGGAAWTQARFDAFQAGMRRGAAGAALRNLRCTAVYVMVAYVDGRRFGAVPSDEQVPNTFLGPGSRLFGVVPSDEIVPNPFDGVGARRFGAVPSDEAVPTDFN